MSYTQAQATGILRALGFRVRTTSEYVQQLRSFQGGYNLGTWLTVDGQLGPKTTAALARSNYNRLHRKPTASAHFSFTEFRCTCRGGYSNCRVVLVRRELLQSLEKYRVRVGPVSIASGYRCPRRNAAVGGATSSQHMYGVAVDIGYKMSASGLAAMHIAAGIGKSRSSGLVRHFDRRDIGGHNLTGGTLSRPTIWGYAS